MTIEVFENIETPAVLLDRKELLQNISRMQKKVDRHHIKLRPHVKTHKSLKIVDLQITEGAHGVSTRTGYGVGYTLETFEKELIPVNIEKLSEEHGFIPRNGRDLSLGTKIRIIPNHSCPVANLAKEYIVLDGSDCEFWPVDALGLVR